jgi:hypothetical protein
VVEPAEAAELAGLRYVTDGDPGIRRLRAWAALPWTIGAGTHDAAAGRG